MTIYIIIPALDPDEKMIGLIKECFRMGMKKIIVVDDASHENCLDIFLKAEKMGCTVIHHKTNLGKGAAIKSALRYLRCDDCSYITADADGQHLPSDIALIAGAMKENPDSLVLGVRNFSEHDVPFRSRTGNAFSSFFFRLATGVKCQDTQTGLRGIPHMLTDKLLSTDGDRYDFEMNFLVNAAKSSVRFVMIPIHTVYKDKNKCSHFHPLRDSFLIYKVPLKFCAASLISAAADLLLFMCLRYLFVSRSVSDIFAATACARVVSGAVNFFLNKKWSFRSGGATVSEALKYIILFVSQITLSSLIVKALSFIPINIVLIKCFTDTVLFIVSYAVQKYWVFDQKQGSEHL